jgi:hypothetical protein
MNSGAKKIKPIARFVLLPFNCIIGCVTSAWTYQRYVCSFNNIGYVAFILWKCIAILFLRSRNYLPLVSTCVHPRFFGEVCVVFCLPVLFLVLSVSLDCPFLISPSHMCSLRVSSSCFLEDTHRVTHIYFNFS